LSAFQIGRAEEEDDGQMKRIRGNRQQQASYTSRC